MFPALPTTYFRVLRWESEQKKSKIVFLSHSELVRLGYSYISDIRGIQLNLFTADITRTKKVSTARCPLGRDWDVSWPRSVEKVISP